MACGCSVIGVDHHVPIASAFERFPGVAVQGNLDPVLLFSEPAVLRREAARILGEVAALGYGVRPYRPDWQEEARRDEYRGALKRLVVAGLGAMQVMMYAVGLYAGALQGMEERWRDLLRVVSAVVATPVLFYAARPFFEGAWRDLGNRRVGMDVPVALALALVLALVLYLGLTRLVIRPVQALSRAAEAIQAGHLGARSQLTRDDELGRL